MSYLFTVIFLWWVIARSKKIKFEKKRVKIESDLERPLLSKNSTKKCSIIKECSCHAMVKVSKPQMSFFLPSNTPKGNFWCDFCDGGQNPPCPGLPHHDWNRVKVSGRPCGYKEKCFWGLLTFSIHPELGTLATLASTLYFHFLQQKSITWTLKFKKGFSRIKGLQT